MPSGLKIISNSFQLYTSLFVCFISACAVYACFSSCTVLTFDEPQQKLT